MLKNQKSIVITFDTTASVFAMERFCKANDLPGKISDLPAALRAGCGLCWKAPADAEDLIMDKLDENPQILWAELYDFDY